MESGHALSSVDKMTKQFAYIYLGKDAANTHNRITIDFQIALDQDLLLIVQLYVELAWRGKPVFIDGFRRRRLLKSLDIKIQGDLKGLVPVEKQVGRTYLMIFQSIV